MSLLEEIAVAITPAISSHECFLEEVTLTPAGKRRIMTVIVDSESHLSLDQVTAVSKDVSEIVEHLSALGDTPFTLEVTSPGIDRPLTVPRHWRKNKGRLVKVTLVNGDLLAGRVGSSSESCVQISEQEVAFADISRAMIEIEFKSIKTEPESGALSEDESEE